MDFLKCVDFGAVAFKFPKAGTSSIKLSRHWREVLSSDLKAYFGSGSSKKGKSSVGADVRRAIWSAICGKVDKADWLGLEEETGVGASKLKRHLKESMKKEGEKFIGN